MGKVMGYAESRDVWTAPLVPVSIALTAGVVLDRYLEIAGPISLGAACVALASWAAARRRHADGLALTYLFAAILCVGAAYHHVYRGEYPPDDIGWTVDWDLRPARLIGEIVEEPAVQPASPADVLWSYSLPEKTSTIVRVQRLYRDSAWQAASGRITLRISGGGQMLHAGDVIDAVGQLSAPDGPANPGELDYESLLYDQRIRAQLHVRDTADAVAVLAPGGRGSLSALLFRVRGWGQQVLQSSLPADSAGIARALLLGDGTAMSRDDWDRYIRTGVIHVLVISGQHLAVLAACGWLLLRLVRIRNRRGGWLIALVLVAYALMTGGRPPILRSAVMVCALCGGMYLGRPVLLPNAFALAWIVVLALNPTDVFNTGCQLSFLTVAVLYWGASRWYVRNNDPLLQVIEASMPGWEQKLRWLRRQVAHAYVVTAVCWLAVTPLVAARYHLISFIGLIIGPPVVLLTSVALISEFLLLASAAVCWPLVPIFAWTTHMFLASCEHLVRFSERLDLVHYVGEIPTAWLAFLYLGLLGALMLKPYQRRWDLSFVAGLAWLCVGFAWLGHRSTPDALRCTFLAVGHGGCTVIETPDGRTLVYDAGAMAGPEVTRRQIAPYLRQRDVRRIDEVFLSHADLDHYNGLAALAERFPIGQVTCTPSFSHQPTQAIAVTLKAVRAHGIPLRVAQAGDRFTSGSLTIDVLHPPEVGPEGPENARSLVLLLCHAGRTILLTGDLEKAGLERVLRLPSRHVDVLMAPHHGSRAANTPELAAWAKPRLVVSSQGRPRGSLRRDQAYSADGTLYLGTWPHGAITIHSDDNGMCVDTFRSRQRHWVEANQ